MKVQATVIIDVDVQSWRADDPDQWSEDVSDLEVALEVLEGCTGVEFDNYLMIDAVLDVTADRRPAKATT